ncbi:peptidase C15 [Aerosakkonemataceae cyanobacterium BLCC-F50]|uniref:Peptidase C15 n=1 Tax=Floridaenema flaviceps BLCC-F50 TaxID=3153642 RepID=A0ABV4XQ71_9CYAN
MSKKVLLTSFTTWLPHQKSNSSDDLLREIAQSPEINSTLLLTFLRQLPVDIQQASDRVIAQIHSLQPDIIVCCGMAESRLNLTVESLACREQDVIKTWVDVERLIADLSGVEISHDAGKFVCEGLYYSILHHLKTQQLKTHCIFVHVPILTNSNFPQIQANLTQIIYRMMNLDPRLLEEVGDLSELTS